METPFTQAYKALNKRQKQAIDTTEGPVLVLAGPGTGKTQLLGTRAAKIVAAGNVNAANILCLTYTESGATEMRERLSRLMGVSGAEVAVHTFHGFGSWLIAQYPEHFSQERSLTPIDELGRYRILQDLLAKLPFRHSLAIRDDNEHFIRQHAVQSAISAFKEAGLTPKQVQTQLARNRIEYEALQPLLDELFGTTLSAKRLPAIAELVASYQTAASKNSYSHLLLGSLQQAVEAAIEAGKTASIGTWRDAHTRIKDKRRVLKSLLDHELLLDTVKLYQSYQQALHKTGRFDYEDMILWAIGGLTANNDMLLDVAERFQYIMVDEYQDTNGAQNKLLQTLLDAHPLDAPNVLVVGDDDQAIMRFQGAELSGMLDFVSRYQPVVVALEDNYRSSQPILDAATAVITASNERLIGQPSLTGISKDLQAHHDAADNSLQHITYQSRAAEYAAIAARIKALIESGVDPAAIGVIGRKHDNLTDFLPFLHDQDITLSYDRRENILEHPAIMQLLRLAKYVSTLAAKPNQAKALLPAVLADPYWQLEVLAPYTLAAASQASKQPWLDTMLNGTDPLLAKYGAWLVAASQATHGNNFTQLFDILIGRTPLAGTELGSSPYQRLYTQAPPQAYATILSHLIALRTAVLASNPAAQTLEDFLQVCDAYRASGIRLIDNNVLLRGGAEGVQLMSAHGSKGREFDHVFVLSCIDELWGSRKRSNQQRIRLPENLPLYPAGDTLDDKLRLLYVAMTRARHTLTMSSYMFSDDGKSRTPLSLLTESLALPAWQHTVADTALDDPARIAVLETLWLPHQQPSSSSLSTVLQPLTKNYRLSPTALRDFLDICYAGPQVCIERHVLKFPSSYNAHSALGSAVHKSLQIAQAAFATGKPLDKTALVETFDAALSASNLSTDELAPARAHGHQFLPAFTERFSASDFSAISQTEQFLRAESPGHHVPLSGVLDAVAGDSTGIKIIDYKTGKPPLPDWKTTGLSESKKISLHFYRQQLLFYALLAEASDSFDAPVTAAELIFVEQSDQTPEGFVRLSITDFDADELQRTEALLHAVYTRIISADLPDISIYPKTLKGILAFENSLL